MSGFLKYPVVLVHGLGAIDRNPLVNFWGRIPRRLRENGVDVRFGNTDSWGDYDSNARFLRGTIEEILRRTGAERVNVLAHSKGGLDARYLIWKHGFGDKIASLTTVSTPHRGSELADLVLKQNPIHSMAARNALKLFGRLFGDLRPDPYASLRFLSTEYMSEFNASVDDDPRVRFRAFYSTMANPLDDPMFFFSYRYLKETCGDNDGIVTERSAKWGSDCVKIGGKKRGISHNEIVDFKRRKISGIDIPDFYVGIALDLAKRGF